MNQDESTTNDDANRQDSSDQGKDEGLGDSVQGEFGDDDPDDYEPDSDSTPKPSFPVRFTRVLWRRRRWRRIGERPSHLREWVNIILTAVIAGATVTQALIYLSQTLIMTRALEQNGNSIVLGQGQLAVAGRNTRIAEDALKSSNATTELDQRAWISVRGAVTLNPPSNLIEIGKPFIARVIFDNTGKTPALNVRMIGMHYIDRTPTPISVDTGNPIPFSKPHVGHQGAFMPTGNAPSGQFADHVFTHSLSPREFEDIEGRTRHAFVEGKMIYCDVFGKQHWVTYCYHLLAGGAWQYCTNNNDVDTDKNPSVCQALARK